MLPSSDSPAVPALDRRVGSFLRSRRESADPDVHRLPSYGVRRVSGLRREEVALLAGVSTSYYTRIEQEAVTASPDVLASVARALDLTVDDRRYLFSIAGFRDPDQPLDERRLVPGVAAMLAGCPDVPIGVLGPDMAILGWNDLCRRIFAPHLLTDPLAEGESLNWAELLFLHAPTRALFRDWDALAADVVGRMRIALGRQPGAVGLGDVVAGLVKRSPDFARVWTSQFVSESSLGRVPIRHPELGDLWLRDTVLRPVDDEEQLVIVFDVETTAG